jgi:hypothetical protein
MQYTASELAKLIETVETEFSGILAKSESVDSAAAPLAKAEDEKPEAKDEKPEHKGEKPEHKEEGKKEDSKEEMPKAAHKEDNKEEKAPEKSEAAPAPAESESDHGYDEEDMEHMHQMYASMSPAERKAHHDCIVKCESMAKCGEMSMEKSEKTSTETIEVPVVIQENPESTLLKSELEATKAKNEELKKNLDGIKEFLTALVKKSAPKGKAITSLDVITKSEYAEKKDLSKTEITSILMKKASDPKLEKTDREAINNYYSTGNVNTISHLLNN